MGISVSATREVFAADFRNRRIVRVSPAGVITVVLRTEPPWSPAGVAIARSGDLYVLEYGFRPPGTWLNPRVRKLTADGHISVVARVPR